MDCPPVALFVFNRPKETAQSFAAIRAARPGRLLIVADGPRSNRPGEAELCGQARAAAEQVDWPCEVSRDFSDVNLGCGRRVASGLDWVFKQEEEAIILEDDCMPDQTFFPFCGELLRRYRDESRVMMISGNNFQDGARPTPDSYYFSKLPHCWGWATWRRAWQLYEFSMGDWSQRRTGPWLGDIVRNKVVETVWRREFDGIIADKVDIWDYQWKYCMWVHDGLSIVPNVNLVANVGVGDMATHTVTLDSRQMVRAEAVTFPLRHPERVARCIEADARELRHLFHLPQSPILGFGYQLLFQLKERLRPVLDRAGLLSRMQGLAARLRG